MAWKIEFKPNVQKQLNKLSKHSQEEIRSYLKEKILKLGHPKLLGKALQYNSKGLWRYRIDKYRIICELQENKLVVLVVRIGKRDVVYDK